MGLDLCQSQRVSRVREPSKSDPNRVAKCNLHVDIRACSRSLADATEERHEESWRFPHDSPETAEPPSSGTRPPGIKSKRDPRMHRPSTWSYQEEPKRLGGDWGDAALRTISR